MLANRMYAAKQKLSGPDCLVPFTHGLVMVIHKILLQLQKKKSGRHSIWDHKHLYRASSKDGASVMKSMYVSSTCVPRVPIFVSVLWAFGL